MRKYQSDAELHNALMRIGLRKISSESFIDDATGTTYTVGFIDPPTPEERGEKFEDIYQSVIESRRAPR